VFNWISNFCSRPLIEGKIGRGTKVWRWSHISKGAIVGNYCMIGANVYIGPNVCIGDYCRIQNGVYIPEGVTIRDGVFIGPNTTFLNHKHTGFRYFEDKLWYENFFESQSKKYTINVDSWAIIGGGCTILPRVTIGRYSVIGAGSLVTKDVKDNSLNYGHPCRFVKDIN